jgi:hypothetical protein
MRSRKETAYRRTKNVLKKMIYLPIVNAQGPPIQVSPRQILRKNEYR